MPDESLGRKVSSVETCPLPPSRFHRYPPPHHPLHFGRPSLLPISLALLQPCSLASVFGGLSGSSNPSPPHKVDDPIFAGGRVSAEDDWESLVLSLLVFNGLPKIHKTPWIICPVIPCHSVMQGPASEFLSKILKTLLADHPQILTSTKELVYYLETSLQEKLGRLTAEQWRNNVYICTADIEGFYTNVPIDDCRSKLKDLVADHFGRHNPETGAKVAFIKRLFLIQQDDLLFKAKVKGVWEIIKQVDGLAMGMPVAPDVANLFTAW